METGSQRNVYIRKEIVGNREYIEIIDTDTGEIINRYWTKITQGKYTPKPTGKTTYFYKVYATNWQDIIQKKKLTLNEVGLFTSLLSFLDWQSPYLINPETHQNLSCSGIAKLMKYDVDYIRKLLDRLCVKGLVAKVNRGEGSACHYMLNTNVVHYGRAMQDLNHTKVFNDKCTYEAPVQVKYKEAVKK